MSMRTTVALVAFVAIANPLFAQQEAVRYTIRFPDTAGHVARVEAAIPARKGDVELFMPVWSPGFYKVEDYAAQVKDLAAKTAGGESLTVEHPKDNRWTVHSQGAESIIVSYSLNCDNAFVTTNWVGEKFAVLNGPATFISLVEKEQRPHEVTLVLPPDWKRSVAGLQAAGEHRYRAPNYELLVDCPIAAGNFDVREFVVGGSRHEIVSLGELGEWKPERPPGDLAKLVVENERMWGKLPFDHYVFILNFRPGGGGLEHLTSTLITSGADGMKSQGRYLGWLSLVSHEYFHTFNVKRLRPIELGPFDYENPPHTPSLWISEGLTSYYGDLIVCRSGLGTPAGFLQSMSSHISGLQNSPGRLKQSLEQSSMEVWTNSRSGVQTKDDTVSYYIKGPVAGFLLDARVRADTDGKRSLDDVMRLAMKRYSGERGFKPEEFVAVAEEVAGTDLKAWFQGVIASATELNYDPALEYFGLKLTKSEGERAAWRLEPKEDASELQQKRLNDWLGATAK